eukprot:gene1928-17060_t
MHAHPVRVTSLHCCDRRLRTRRCGCRRWRYKARAGPPIPVSRDGAARCASAAMADAAQSGCG